MRHSPPQSLLCVLVTCPKCSGETTYQTEADGICRCGECSNGYISIALPLLDVLFAASIPSDTARHAHLLSCAKQQGKVAHPLIYTSVSVPTHYTTPLIPNISDGKRRIPLAPKP